MAETLKTIWHDFPALTLENEAMRVVIVPELGAKIVSLYDKNHGREWLVPPIRPVKQTVYGSVFVDQDMSGWDEMLPTIIACTWEGAHLPDHGEVWSIPWNLESVDGGVTLSIDGMAVPYHFRRSAALVAPDILELRYSLKNTGQKDLSYLWAAHPQFAADTNTRIVFPPEVKQVVNVIEDDPVWGKADELYGWPEATSAAGHPWRLDRIRSLENHACRKFYTLPEQPVSWAALVDEKLGCQLRLDWPSEFAPYLGLWIDEGMFNTAPVAALEPANGYYDSLENSIAHQRVAVLEPGQETTWTIKVGLGDQKLR
jgi:galactose mutarotase-like enzyme